jgi:hypothetical protein
MVDYDPDFMIEVGSYIGDDDIYPPALGKISDDSTPSFGGHCMMASHGDGNEHRSNDGRNRSNTGRQFITQDQIRYARRVYAGEVNMGPNPSPQELAALRFIVQEHKYQISADRRILERRRDEADASSRRRAERSSHYSSSVQHRSRLHIQPGANMHNIARNLEAEFNEADLLPKTKEAAIMAIAAYIAANAANDDEHMRHLRNLALEGVRVLQGTANQGRETMPRRTIPLAEQSRHPAAALAVAPRTRVVEPINGELRHGLAQNRVNNRRAWRDARRFEEERDMEAFGGSHDGLCGAECFSLLIRSTPLPKGIKLGDGVVKFNGKQDPRIWLDDFMTTVTIGGGSRDNALQLLSLHLKDNARAWLNNLAPDSICSWEEFRQAFIANFRGTSRRPTSFEELRLCVQRTEENLRSYISRWISLRNTAENISPERAIDAFRDGLIQRDFKEELGRCKPKTVDHLMSLANEWADGEDSIIAPRSRRRSAERDVDAKDQFHTSSQKKGCRNCYDNADTTDMVAAGYVNEDRDDSRDRPRRGNNYYGSSSRSAGRDSRPKTEWRR